ncbi:MAG TPA: hypothetical protein VJP89_23145 [Pyrinomonadaceae bacterium]|nr:hypothetical protein [Pyrinomonadaceae bacterium]
MAGMQKGTLPDYSMPRDQLLALKKDLEEKLFHVNTLLFHLDALDALIKKDESGPPKGELKMMPLPEQRVEIKKARVRGVLAAAKRAIEQFSGPFDKNQLLAKLIEDEEFAHKEITGSNIRNALRLLTRDGIIKVESGATATSCAKYVKAA